MGPSAHIRNCNHRVYEITEYTRYANRDLRTLGNTNIKEGVEEGSMKRSEEEQKERHSVNQESVTLSVPR